MRKVCALFVSILLTQVMSAQQITGVWKGKINKRKVEVKIIQNGDRLTGTSYYYESTNNFRRYSIKGYFDPNTNEAVWWDDELIEEGIGKGLALRGYNAYLSSADFNCPGGARMMLDGQAALKEKPDDIKGAVALEKTGVTAFRDEWDFVIENYTVGTNDPDLIDSVDHIAGRQPVQAEEKPIVAARPERRPVVQPTVTTKDMVRIPPTPEPVKTNPVPLTIEQKFTSREKVIALEIPLSGDSIALDFYDNAEIDGDSISLFLNDQLIFSHIRLTGKAYSIKLPVAGMADSNELTMVAENLGEIPPNTSYMVAIVDNKRYEVVLASTEGSSATVRFTRKHQP